MNRVLLTGRLTRDPEMRALASGKHVTTMAVATNEYIGNGREKAEFHAVITWDRLADICAQYLGKGSLVAVEGRLQTRHWDDEAGKRWCYHAPTQGDPPMPAYAYLRKSSVHDPRREVSHEMQEAAVRGMAARHGDDNGKLIILSDWDRSGRLGADRRPGYRALLEAIETGQATAVYSYSLSRLARSVAELSRLIARCVERGVPVRLHADHVDTSTASGMLLAHVLSAVAQFEADVASERVRGANAAKLARGESLATVKCYGEAAGEDTGDVLAAFRDAGSYSGAAKLLNERGVKPRNSARGWWPSSVAVVVKRVADPGPRRPTRGYAAGGTDFALARLLRCPTCGTMLTGTRDRGGSRVRYSCRLGTSLPHPRISVTEHLILPAIQIEVSRLRPPDVLSMETADEQARVRLSARRTEVIDMAEHGYIDRAERDRRMARIADEMAALDSRRVAVAIPAVDWTWPPRQLNAVLHALLDAITLDPATFQPLPDGFAWRVPEWRS